MFKFLWKLLKRIQIECRDNIDFVRALADSRQKKFCAEVLGDCCTQSGDPMQPQYVTAVQTAIRKAFESDPTTTPELIDALIKAFGSEKQLKPKPEVINGYFKSKRGNYYTLLRRWHFQLAIADMLLGHYEELDPIIGDQACEMRCPFLLDMARVITGLATSFSGQKGEGLAYLQSLAKRVYMDGQKIPTDNPPELNIKVITGYLDSTAADFTAFCLHCHEQLGQLDGPTVEEFMGLASVAENVTYVVTEKTKSGEETTERTIDLFAPQFNDIKKITIADDADLPADMFSAAEYLRLCKSFTRNREALIDDFGIDIDHESTLNFYDVAFKQSRFTLKSLNREISDYEKQLLAHCSSSYMKFAARKLALENNGNTLFTPIKDVFGGCQATINGSGFLMNLLPVYDAFRVILGHAARNGDPIVVNLTRMMVIESDEDSQDIGFKHQKSWVLYYEPNEQGQFVFVPEPSETQKQKPAIAVVASSVVNPDKLCTTDKVAGSDFVNALDPEQFLAGFTQCDLGHLLMLFGANHPTFPASTCVPRLNLLEPQTVNLTLKKPEKVQLPSFVWEPPVNQQTGKADCGRDYARKGLYVSYANANADPHPSDIYQFSLLTTPCPLFAAIDNGRDLAWEYDYYLHLTEALGHSVESVKYALMDGGRDSYDGDTVWKRNLDTLPFTPTHMYVACFNSESEHQARIGVEEGTVIDIAMHKSTMKRKSSCFKITYDIEELLEDDNL